jgi:DNA primase
MDDVMAAEARSVRIESEISRRGIKLATGVAERCGPCPVCGGTDRFSINLKKQVWNCRGCTRGGDVIALVQHIDGSDFKGAVERLAGSPRQAAAEAKPKRLYFPYTDEAGVALSREIRLQYPDGSKKTWQEAADPDRPGQWITGEGCMDGVRSVPFGLPGLIEALKVGETIFIVEGPRKCGPLHEWGLAATCNIGGSSNAKVWREHAREFFLPIYSSQVIILPDNDAPGAKSAAIIAGFLASVGVTVSLLDLPGWGPGGSSIWCDHPG